jgi:hypothetical protein
MPSTRLAKLANGPGGRLRDAAITAATTRVEALRDDGMDGIGAALAEVEGIAKSARNGHLDTQQLIAIQTLADRIITLAGTFGFKRLDEISRSLVDLIHKLLAAGIGPAGPVLIHIRTARLFAPKSPSVAAPDAQRLLSELRKVSDHFSAAKGAKTPAEEP